MEGNENDDSSGHDVFNVAKTLAEFKKSKRTRKVETEMLDLDLLLGSPPKKKPSKPSKEEKKNKNADGKLKKPVYSSNDEEEEDDEEEQARTEAACQKALEDQRNRNRFNRLMATTSTHNAGTNLLFYLALNKHREQYVANASTDSLDVVDDENVESSVWIKWRFSKMMKFQLKKSQTFDKIFKHYSEKENVPVERISLETESGQQVYPHDTPRIVGLERNAILEGCVLTAAVGQTEKVTNDGKVEIKIQLPDSRNNMVVRLARDEPMKNLMEEVADSLDLSLNDLKFLIDGELVEQNQTPEDLDLEGGEVIDLNILK